LKARARSAALFVQRYKLWRVRLGDVMGEGIRCAEKRCARDMAIRR